jgi:hypothetical protein
MDNLASYSATRISSEKAGLVMFGRIWKALLTLLLLYIVLELITAALEQYLSLIILGLILIALVWIIRRGGKGI